MRNLHKLNHLVPPHSVGIHTATQMQLNPFYTLYMSHTLYMLPCKASVFTAIQENPRTGPASQWRDPRHDEQDVRRDLAG